MAENRARLVDATRRLLQSGTSEEDAIKSMSEVGLSDSEARSIVQEAKLPAQKKEKPSEKGAVVAKPAEITKAGEEKPEKAADAKPALKQPVAGPSERNQSIYLAPGRIADSGKDDLASVEPHDHSVEKKAELHKPYRRIGITEFRKTSPVLVHEFDRLIEKGGLKRGDILLLSGGSGTGKTTFGIQSLYWGAKIKGEKGIYISLEESPEKLKENMAASFGWDLDPLESKGLLAMVKVDPLAIVRAMEANLTSEKGSLYIEPGQFNLPFLFDLPFTPDRLVFDSLSSVSMAFAENTQGFRQYTTKLFETLSGFGSLNIVIEETARNPGNYNLVGLHELLADSLVSLYGLKTHNRRENALEIIKMRGTGHAKRLVPYKITQKGFEVYADQEFFFEE